jgi:hypothetical protein
MTKQLAAILILIVLIGGAAQAARSSASYRISSEIMDGGVVSSASTSFHVAAKTRERQLASRSSTSFIFGEGFFRSAYFAGIIPVLSPLVTGVTPSSAANTGTVAITNLSGANFQSGATVKLSRSGQTNINASSVVVVSAGKITCAFDLTGAAGGVWDVTVTNTDGRSGTLPSGFTVTFAAPAVVSITPNSGTNNGPVNITSLTGTNFRTGAVVRLAQNGQNDIVASAVAVPSASTITCSFDLTGKAAGLWDVKVTNDDGQTGTLPASFKVETPNVAVVKPVVSSQNPFNPAHGSASINYTLSKDANIIIYIYDIRGQRIWQYAAPAGGGGGSTGGNSVVWDGLTAFKTGAASGVYIVEVTTTDGGFKVLSRMNLIVTR